MLQLQNQLNQAIKNQIAMLNTAQSGGGSMHHDNFPIAGTSHRPSLLGHRSRHYGAEGVGAPSSGRNMDHVRTLHCLFSYQIFRYLIKRC